MGIGNVSHRSPFPLSLTPHHSMSNADIHPTAPRYAEEDTKEGLTQHVEANELDPESGPKRRKGVNRQMDDAAALLEEAGLATGQLEASPEERKRVLRKIDLYVCVPMCIVYCIQSLDKGSISYASVFDLQTASNLVGSQYSWLSS